VYGLDFSLLVPLAQQAVANPNVRAVAPDQLLASPQEYARLDMATQTPASLEALNRDLAFAITCDGNLVRGARIDGHHRSIGLGCDGFGALDAGWVRPVV
jgi:hypothetical protein